MDVGGELERARESLGLSLEQISARTKVSVERLAAIEQNAFEQLPPIVYVKGFVRSYATEVGLDPDDVTERYLAQFDETSMAHEPSALDVFASEGSAKRVDDEAAERADDGEELSEPVVVNDAAPIESVPDRQLPVMVGAVAAAATPLWQRAEFLPHTLGGDRASVEPPTSSPAPLRASRKVPVKALAAVAVITLALGYLVSTNLDRFWQADPSGADVAASNTADEPSADKAGGEVAPATATATGDADNAAAATPASDAAAANTPPDAPVAASSGNAPPAEDVSGSWMLTTQVESSSYKPFNNLRLGYRVQLQQSGNRVTGSGFKWTENGRDISSTGRTPILLEGTLKGRRLDLKFTERGARRASGGTIVMDVADDGSLRGNFAGDAARSRGSSQARRTP